MLSCLHQGCYLTASINSPAYLILIAAIAKRRSTLSVCSVHGNVFNGSLCAHVWSSHSEKPPHLFLT